MRLIKELKIKDKIILLDPVPRENLPYYLSASDCVVVPSLNEGFGFTAAESCAVGTPVVATTAGSLPEVVSGKHVLIKPHSSNEIVKGVEMVYKKQYRKSKVKKFSWNDCIKRYERIYEIFGKSTNK